MKDFLTLTKHNIHSLKELIDTLYPNLVNDNLFNDKIDKRYYLDFFINYLNIPKKDVFEKIKAYCGIEYIENFDNLDKGSIIKSIKNLDVLKKYGFCPIIKEQKLKILITSNPFLINTKFNIPSNVKIFLTTGGDLSTFLDSLVENDVTNDNEDAFFETIKALIIEIEEKGISNIIFEKFENKVFYNIKDIDDNWKRGQIINQDINEFWNKLSSNFIVGFNKNKFFKSRKLNVINEKGTIILKWSIPKKILAMQNNIAVVTSDEQMSEKINNYLKSIQFNTKNYSNLFDLYNDYKNYKFKLVVICLSTDALKKEHKLFRSHKSKSKNILIDFDGIKEVEAYLMGVDYYIDNNFTCEYLCDVVKNLYK